MKRWNKNFEDLTGYSEEELKNKYLGDFHNDEGRKRAMAAIEKVIEDGQERGIEHDVITKSGEIIPHYYGTGKLVEIGGELLIVGQAVDEFVVSNKGFTPAASMQGSGSGASRSTLPMTP